MKKLKEMKKNNKGFSLVELIIVIAIMAVLMAVLAPQFLRYVERSRLQSDNTAIGEIANACKVAATNEAVAGAVATGDITVTIPVTTAAALSLTGGDGGTGNAALLAELTATIGNVALTSNTYTPAGAACTIVLHLNATTDTIEVHGIGYVAEVGGTATTAAAPRIF